MAVDGKLQVTPLATHCAQGERGEAHVPSSAWKLDVAETRPECDAEIMVGTIERHDAG